MNFIDTGKMIRRQGEKIFELEKQVKKIFELEKQVKESKAENRELRIQLADLRDENEDCYRRIFKQNKALLEMQRIAEGNTYNNERVILNKIIELAKTGIND